MITKRYGRIALSTLLILSLPISAYAKDFRGRGSCSGSEYSRHSNGYGGYGPRAFFEHGRPSRSSQRSSPWAPSSWSPNDRAIQRGIHSGRLSNREVSDLREDQRDIRRKEMEYRSDGYLSSKERKDLAGDYREFREDLDHEMNDGERRWWLW